jgi:hypothetical protein
MRSPYRRRSTPGAITAALALGVLGAACAPAVTTTSPPTPPQTSATAPSPDPRIGLRPGLFDAGEAIWNLRKLSSTPPPREFLGVTNSDLAFSGNLVYQGNYNGFMVWDIANPSKPHLTTWSHCPASQSDISVYGNLAFVSAEGPAAGSTAARRACRAR